jgi:2-polyprenyl-3-methyl-5-hydroxy-6-metoxy-1,4-benzoquinol methylase
MDIQELFPFMRSEHSIWTDEHIAKSLLGAHLDLQHDAASRRMATIKKTAAWIEKTIPEKARILDLGCGPGLYAAILARHGYTVTGVDVSRISIEHAEKTAREKGLPIKYRCMNYLTEAFEGSFQAVLMIYCDFGALIPDEQAVVLRKIRSCLTPDGVFVFDVFGQTLPQAKKEQRNWLFSKCRSFWHAEPHLLLDEVRHFPDASAIGSRNIVITEDAYREYITWDQYYNDESISRLLEARGFEVIQIMENLIPESDFASNDVKFIVCRAMKQESVRESGKPA